MAKRLTPQQRFTRLHETTAWQQENGLQALYGNSPDKPCTPCTKPNSRAATPREIARHLEHVRRGGDDPQQQFEDLHNELHYQPNDAVVGSKELGQQDIEDQAKRRKAAYKRKGLR